VTVRSACFGRLVTVGVACFGKTVVVGVAAGGAAGRGLAAVGVFTAWSWAVKPRVGGLATAPVVCLDLKLANALKVSAGSTGPPQFSRFSGGMLDNGGRLPMSFRLQGFNLLQLQVMIPQLLQQGPWCRQSGHLPSHFGSGWCP
jgi:hypothetical protein